LASRLASKKIGKYEPSAPLDTPKLAPLPPRSWSAEGLVPGDEAQGSPQNSRELRQPSLRLEEAEAPGAAELSEEGRSSKRTAIEARLEHLRREFCAVDNEAPRPQELPADNNGLPRRSKSALLEEAAERGAGVHRRAGTDEAEAPGVGELRAEEGDDPPRRSRSTPTPPTTRAAFEGARGQLHKVLAREPSWPSPLPALATCVACGATCGRCAEARAETLSSTGSPPSSPKVTFTGLTQNSQVGPAV
jgi:bacterioferritin-associated ferredoxin